MRDARCGRGFDTGRNFEWRGLRRTGLPALRWRVQAEVVGGVFVGEKRVCFWVGRSVFRGGSVAAGGFVSAVDEEMKCVWKV